MRKGIMTQFWWYLIKSAQHIFSTSPGGFMSRVAFTPMCQSHPIALRRFAGLEQYQPIGCFQQDSWIDIGLGEWSTVMNESIQHQASDKGCAHVSLDRNE